MQISNQTLEALIDDCRLLFPLSYTISPDTSKPIMTWSVCTHMHEKHKLYMSCSEPLVLQLKTSLYHVFFHLLLFRLKQDKKSNFLSSEVMIFLNILVGITLWHMRTWWSRLKWFFNRHAIKKNGKVSLIFTSLPNKSALFRKDFFWNAFVSYRQPDVTEISLDDSFQNMTSLIVTRYVWLFFLDKAVQEKNMDCDSGAHRYLT